MKTLQLAIILFVSSLSIMCLSSLQAYAIPYTPPQVEYYNSDIVLIGKVISAIPFSSTQMKYGIQVEQYLKNPQPQNTIMVIADGTNKTKVEMGMAPDTVFDVGDRAFLFLKNEHGNYIAWWFSHHTDSLCDPAPTQEDLNVKLPKGVDSGYTPLHIGTSDDNSSVFKVGQPITISYDTWNRHFTTQAFDVEFDVKNSTSNQVIFNNKQKIELKACIGHQSIATTFVPKTAGAYEVDVNFDNSLIGRTIETRQNVGCCGKLEHAPILSPLQQFKSGIAAKDVICNSGLILVIKLDYSPACVKLDTAYMLIIRGWAYSESAYPEGDGQFALKTNSTIIPGHLPRHSGVRIPYSESSRIINYTGFDGVYNVTLMFRGTPQDYVLKPGTTGTITFKIGAKASELLEQSYPIPLPKSLNLTNYAVFYHEITSIKELAKYPGVTISDYEFKTCFTRPVGEGTCIGGQYDGKNPIEAYVVDHPGVNILFAPPSEVLPLGTNTTSQIVTMMISADSDAPQGTYLVELSPSGEFLLTVGSQPYHE